MCVPCTAQHNETGSIFFLLIAMCSCVHGHNQQPADTSHSLLSTQRAREANTHIGIWFIFCCHVSLLFSYYFVRLLLLFYAQTYIRMISHWQNERNEEETNEKITKSSLFSDSISTENWHTQKKKNTWTPHEMKHSRVLALCVSFPCFVAFECMNVCFRLMRIFKAFWNCLENT